MATYRPSNVVKTGDAATDPTKFVAPDAIAENEINEKATRISIHNLLAMVQFIHHSF
jgi:hypothetical protein